MPHLTLEYSSNVREREFKPLFPRLHHVLTSVASADLDSCKSRALECSDFLIGNGDSRNGFVHLKIFMLEGRSLAVRQEVGKKMLHLLSEFFSHSVKELNFQITVEIGEFLRNLYFKIPSEI
ncbi:MAG: 5-carboxymethyl-2-hydroxymuconate Delta-isomerase [Verrucomicrobia bacterium]|nr:5-carboxymethyl-2-hydroxymuconate Delta-isomerase [Verrucomicrobiota bacterium]